MNKYETNISTILNELDQFPANPARLVSKNAGESTKKLFDYLKSIYGKNILSGQQIGRASCRERV